MTSGRRLARWLPALLLLAAAGVVAEPPLPRVASTNLCADLLLLGIAAPAQVVSVSRDSQDPRLSPVVAEARAYPANHGAVEELLTLGPEIALVYLGWNGRGHADLLAGQGVRVLPVAYPKDWADALDTAARVAKEIGRGEAGAAQVELARRRMEGLARRADGRPRYPYRVLYLRPNGGSAGTGTYVDDVLRRLGLRNLAAEQGLTGWGRYPLEALVAAPPDLFLLGYFDQDQPLTASAYARHPLLRRLLARTPSIAVPSNRFGCGGLELVQAAAEIAAQIDRLAPPADASGGTPPR